MQAAQQPLLSPDDSAAEAGYASPQVATFRRGSDASQYSPLPFGSPPQAQGTSPPGAFAFPTRAPLPTGPLPTGLPRRRWRGSLLACCGAWCRDAGQEGSDHHNEESSHVRPPPVPAPSRRTPGSCSRTDIHSCCLATFLPCVAWAHNQHRAFDVNFVGQLALYFFFVYVLRAAAVSVLTTCQLADSLRDGASCHIASLFAGSFWVALASSFALYAAWRRAALRRRFGIGGVGACASAGDVAAWMLCPACALCQETRTLAHNNVRQGFWLGPSGGGAGAGVTAPLAGASTGEYIVQPGVPIIDHVPTSGHAGLFEPASPVLGAYAPPPMQVGQAYNYTAPSAVQTPVTELRKGSR